MCKLRLMLGFIHYKSQLEQVNASMLGKGKNLFMQEFRRHANLGIKRVWLNFDIGGEVLPPHERGLVRTFSESERVKDVYIFH